MVHRQIDAVAELQNAFSVLFKNWVLAVPMIAVWVIVAVLAVIFLGASLASGIMSGGLSNSSDPYAILAMLRGVLPVLGLLSIVVILLLLIAQAVVIGGAEHVWHGQPADLSGGVSRALAKLPALFGLFLISLVIGFICGLLSIVVIGPIIGLVLVFFFMYTVPAIVIGNEGAFAALKTSWRLVSQNIGPSLTAFFGIIVVYIIGAILQFLFSHVPILGMVVNLAVSGLIAAFAALVVVRFYDLLSGASAPAVTSGPPI